MQVRKYRYFMGDFETTVYQGQVNTEVWASAVVEFNTEDVKIFGCIEEFLEYIMDIPCNKIIYFHNLKFDGEFIISYLLNNGFEHILNKKDKKDSSSKQN